IDPDGRAGWLTDARDWFDETDEALRNFAGQANYFSKEIGVARGALSLASAPVRGLNFQSDLYLQAMPRAIAPELVDQASSELGARIDAAVPAVSNYLANPIATNARFQYNMVAGLTETSLRAAQGDGRATSDLTSLVTPAVLPEL